MLSANSYVGNFVETKNASIASNSLACHLAYIGAAVDTIPPAPVSCLHVKAALGLPDSTESCTASISLLIVTKLLVPLGQVQSLLHMQTCSSQAADDHPASPACLQISNRQGNCVHYHVPSITQLPMSGIVLGLCPVKDPVSFFSLTLCPELGALSRAAASESLNSPSHSPCSTWAACP